MSRKLSIDERLKACAQLWAEANGSSPARLGRLVANDTKFFTRLDAPGASTTIAMAERFARFLADPANWPEGNVPEEVRAFAHVTGVSVADATPSTGLSNEKSSRERAA